MEFEGVLYQCEEITDVQTLAALPEELQEFYSQTNGLVAFQGGLTIRGCVQEPLWLSLAEAWKGETALHLTYEQLEESDIPFAYDCCGDQYFLRDGSVFRLCGENGEIEDYGIDLWEFIEDAAEEPDDYLDLQPLHEFMNEGGELKPGEMLHIYPPFMIEESEEEVHVLAAPVHKQMEFLRKFYLIIKDLDDTTQIELPTLDLDE